MEPRLLVSGLLYVVVLALGQGKPASEASASWQNRTTSLSCAANLTRLEHKINHKLHDTEHRLSTRIDDKIRLVNQSATILYLERLLHHVNEELQLVKNTDQHRTEMVRHIRQQANRQQHEIHRLKNTVEHLRKTVSNLSGLVEQLLQARGSTDTRASTAVTPTTTAAPFRPLFPTDCQDVYKNGGMKYPGYYYIMIQPFLASDPFKVACKMTNNSGWTLIQRRQDGSVDFYRTWREYKHGFGSLEGEFWIGNDHIYELTNQGNYKLRIEMTDWEGKSYFAEYDHFRVSDGADKYRLHVHGYHGNAGDSLTSHWENHDNQAFSTKDSDNDNRFYDNCAEHYHGAWWFKSCFESHLNGVYYHKGSHSNYFVRNGIQWNSIHLHSSLQNVAMMVKPNAGVVEKTSSTSPGDKVSTDF